MKKINLQKKINEKILEYYKSYYLNELGLPDWKQRANNRLLEEKTFSSKIFEEILSKIQFNFKNKKILVNGCGTGGELIYAANVLNADAYGIEPNEKALEICNMKAQLFGIDKERVINAVAENLPFEDNVFDVYTISFGIRNVTRPQEALKEAYRVLKPGGRIMVLEFSQIPVPLGQWFYDRYSFNLIPKLGEIIASDRQSYQYLVESIRKFPDQETFLGMIESAGFENTKYRNLTLGIACLHSGWKI